ncbi:hypothetical protein HNQ93_000743 [Hymenobacter luteus]|uniref:PKD-like domain-containing protein n=2 Tax=Hymenobacter TaxID=89966 RepID=A0A7W9SYN0_9BACT|nr:hypothetical protein [Hymenobacter latericoloratus]MBB4599777.1 hypothetical protein [Hymenobacter latericoloratus]MBB6057913.1 hypothetical protein [Hymenobacter luteus]
MPISPSPSVIIKSVFGININGPITSSGGTDLPLCGGAQTLTLSVPQYYYDDARQYPAEAYVWEIPSNFTVVNGVQATEFGAGRWLSGNSITITVPAGQFSQVVRVVIWSKDCNQNPAYGNPPATLISFAQSVVIRRTTPVISSVTASRASLTCGDRSPLTLTAITSQAGVSSFQWSLPAGWAFASGSSSNAASISVIPTGSAPAGGSNIFQIGVTARYACVVPACEASL